MELNPLANKSPGMWLLVVSLLLLLGLRLGYFYGYAGADAATRHNATAGGDTADFIAIACTLAQTGHYARPADPDTYLAAWAAGRKPAIAAAGTPDAWRPPGWPALMAVVLRVSDYDLKTVMLVRFACDAASLILFFFLLRALRFPAMASGLAVPALAVHPAWLAYSVTYLTEPIAMLLLLVTTLLAVKLSAAKTAAWGWCAGLGIAGGCLILVHPFWSFFPLLMMLAVAWRQRSVPNTTVVPRIPRRVRVQVCACLVITGLVVAPWCLRNMHTFNTKKPTLTTSMGYVLGMGWSPSFLALYENRASDAILPSAPPMPAPPYANAAASSQAHARGAFHFARSHWRLLPAIVTRKLVGALTPIPEIYRPGVLEQGRAIFQTLCFLPMIWIFFSRIPAAARLRLVAIPLLAAYLAMAVITYPCLRFHMPLAWLEAAALGLAVAAIGAPANAANSSSSKGRSDGFPKRHVPAHQAQRLQP